MWSLPESSPSIDAANRDRLHQIVHNFFLKAAAIVLSTRSELNAPIGAKRSNQWFELETIENDFRFPETASLQDSVRRWQPKEPAPEIEVISPMVIETYLDLRKLNQQGHRLFVHHDGRDIVVPRHSKKTEVVLERWFVELDLTTLDGVPPSAVYKQCAALFQSLDTYTRLLPANDVCRRLAPSGTLTVGCRVLEGTKPIDSKGRIGLSKVLVKLITTKEPLLHLAQYKFADVVTSKGTLRISVSYRLECDFREEPAVGPGEGPLKQLSGAEYPRIYVENESEVVASEAGPAPRVRTLSEASSSHQSHSPPLALARVGDPSHPPTIPRSWVPSSPIKVQMPTGRTSDSLRRFSLTSTHSVSPGMPSFSSSPAALRRLSTTSSQSRIQMFKSGSVTGSPPPATLDQRGSFDKDRRSSFERDTRPLDSRSNEPDQRSYFGRHHSDTPERRVSVGSDRVLDPSHSNASLAAILRNPRSGSVTSLNHLTKSGAPGSVVSSEGVGGLSSPDGAKFSLSFTYTQSRRQSLTGGQRSVSAQRTAARRSSIAPSDPGSPRDSHAYAGALLSDSDIGEFVKMIDDKQDLRLIDTALSSSSLFNPLLTGFLGGLEFQRYRSMKSEYDDLGLKLSALVLNHHVAQRLNEVTDRPYSTSRRASITSSGRRVPPLSEVFGSPQLLQRLGLYSPGTSRRGSDASARRLGSPSRLGSIPSVLEGSAASSRKYPLAPTHRVSPVPGGLYSLTGDIRRSHGGIEYADVFDDDEEEAKKPLAADDDTVDDDLLFEMSDVHLNRS